MSNEMRLVDAYLYPDLVEVLDEKMKSKISNFSNFV